MSTLPDRDRQAAHILVDGAVAWDDGASPEANGRAMELAVTRLEEVDVVEVHESGAIDVSHLVYPAVMSIYWLVRRAARSSDLSFEEVASELRDFLDS